MLLKMRLKGLLKISLLAMGFLCSVEDLLMIIEYSHLYITCVVFGYRFIRFSNLTWHIPVLCFLSKTSLRPNLEHAFQSPSPEGELIQRSGHNCELSNKARGTLYFIIKGFPSW